MIRWKKPERRLVVLKYHALLAEGKQNTNTDRLKEAEKVLPPERRTGGTHAIAFWINKLHKQMEASSFDFKAWPVPPLYTASSVMVPHLNGHAHKRFEVPADQPDNSQAEGGFEPRFEVITIEKIVVVKEQPDYGRIPTETLCRILTERLAMMEDFHAKFLQLQDTSIRKREQEQIYDRRIDTRPPQQQPEPVKAVKLRVIVVGMLNSQQTEIKTRCASISDKVELSFYDSDHEGQPLPQKIDYIVLSKFVSHKWWNKCKAVIPSDRLSFIDGGIQSIVQKIYDIASRQPSGALAISNGTNTQLQPVMA